MDGSERERWTTMGELSAILAHELKNPMNSIIINLEVLRSSLTDPTRAKHYVDVIETEIRRLDKVIRNFLDLSHPEPETKAPIRLNRVIKTLLEFLNAEMVLKNIQCSSDYAEDLPAITGSPDQIKQALLNLFLNAIQALPKGGRITIKTFAGDRDIAVEVSDTGNGIDDYLLGKIFDPFFTTKTRGSGLGLTIVRRVVRDHGGAVQVDSVVGQGTTFTLRFPRLNSTPAPEGQS